MATDQSYQRLSKHLGFAEPDSDKHERRIAYITKLLKNPVWSLSPRPFRHIADSENRG